MIANGLILITLASLFVSAQGEYEPELSDVNNCSPYEHGPGTTLIRFIEMKVRPWRDGSGDMTGKSCAKECQNALWSDGETSKGDSSLCCCWGEPKRDLSKFCPADTHPEHIGERMVDACFDCSGYLSSTSYAVCCCDKQQNNSDDDSDDEDEDENDKDSKGNSWFWKYGAYAR